MSTDQSHVATDAARSLEQLEAMVTTGLKFVHSPCMVQNILQLSKSRRAAAGAVVVDAIVSLLDTQCLSELTLA